MIDKKPKRRRPSRKTAAKRPARKAPRAKKQSSARRPPKPGRLHPVIHAATELPPRDPEPMLESAHPASLLATPSHTFPIVGIGASAGGLEALEAFLSHVPRESGAAYVVVQHLNPSDKGMLVELLQRASNIPVEQARDRVLVEPDRCYVIPPNFDMSLMRGALHLLPQSERRGLNLPIDFFFRSLAADQMERSIGVILSGMGFDGTLGLRAIKERAGAAFVQALNSAKFEGMPRSAIDAGVADVVAPVEELPARIAAYHAHTHSFARRDASPEERAQSSLEKVFLLLRSQTGNDFFLYKRSTILRRIERRMGLHQIESIPNYLRYLRENPREIDLLFKELLIGVTNFFRDPPTWEYLKHEVMPGLLAPRSVGGSLRAWVPGCSTGEEAYSLAMVFKEAMDPFKPTKNIRLQIFATDLDRDAIEKARQGLYSETITADVSPERLRRFFVQEERGYRVSKEIREMVVFAPQNIIMDPPFTKLDILSCRNLLIYLSAELQKKLIPLFHYSLNPDGVLLLGSAETVGSFTNLFHQLDGKNRFYRRLEQPAAVSAFEFPSTFVSAPAQSKESESEQATPANPPPASLERLADRVLVQRFAPLGVLCNEKGDILYVSGRAGKYFEPAVGKANLNVFAMARDGLRYELSSAFATAMRESRPVVAHGVNVRTNGHTQPVDLTVQKLVEPKELRGTMMVVLADVQPQADAKRTRTRRSIEPIRIAELEHDLQRAREEVQTTREEMQTSQEELKSTNEELQSANEELQSTNEELTTSKEEMQSLNEELQTVNHELQSKVDELSRSNNDMKNLLNSTDIATLFLDGELRVRRFTTPTAKIIKLIPGDAGRMITDITSDLDYPELADDAREVLRTLVFKERQGATRDGRWYLVRIMPYRTLENVIDGVVITFTDASASRALQESLREQASQLKQMAESLPTLVWNCKPDGSCDYVSRRWVEYTGVPDAELRGYGWIEQVHLDEREHVRDTWRASVRTGSDFDCEFRIRSANGSYRWFQTRAVAIRDSHGNIHKWYGTNTDVDDLKHSTLARQRDAGISSVLANIAEGYLAVDSQMALVACNPAAERILKRSADAMLGKHLFDVLQELRNTDFETNIANAIRNGAHVAFEHALNQPHGTFRFRIFPHRDPEGVAILVDTWSSNESASQT